jgi:Flp pilus assembly pilin Flp
MQNFIQDETGAVTVDWVVLTAALVGLGLAVMGVVSSGISSQADAIDDTLTNESIIRTSFTSGAVADFGTACGNFGGCDASLGNLASLSNSDFNALRDSFSTDEAGAVATTNTGLGLTQDGDGNWVVLIDDVIDYINISHSLISISCFISSSSNPLS